VHILLATDADWIVDEVVAALGGPDTSFTVCREGRVVADVVGERVPDLAVLDLQIGSMGAMAVTMALRLDESSGALPHVQRADAARPSGRRAPRQPLRCRGLAGQAARRAAPERAAAAVLNGGTYAEGFRPRVDARSADPPPMSRNRPRKNPSPPGSIGARYGV
jgi:CheY-like chemotaxis protein